jgi:hypothetical protein
MALVLGQATVGTAATVKVCTVPAGPFSLTLLAGATAGVFVGTGTATTVTTGAFIPASGQVQYTGFPTASGASIYAAAGTATTLSYHLCTTF